MQADASSGIGDRFMAGMEKEGTYRCWVPYRQTRATPYYSYFG